MANITLWCVGDSWSAGWAGVFNDVSRRFSHTMIDQAAMQLGITNVKNYSVPGASMGLILNMYLSQVSYNMQSGDVLFVCAPPDTRYYRIDGPPQNKNSFKSASLYNGIGDEEYITDLMKHNSVDFFKWHYALFCKAICDDATIRGVECYVQHNYGSLPIEYDWFDSNIFLDKQQSMWDWMELPVTGDFFNWCDGPDHDYIESCSPTETAFSIAEKKLIIDGNGDIDLHPNQKYHKILGNRISDLILERRQQQ